MQFYKPLVAVVLLSGCALFESKTPTVTVRFHEQVSDVLPDTHVRTVDVPGTRLQVAVDPFPQLTEKDVAEARLETTPGGQAVRLKFDMHGATKLTELTTRMRGRYLVIFVNDRPVAAVLVDKRIVNGEFLVEGVISDEEQQALVDGLNKFAGRHRDIGDTRYQQ